VTGVFGLLVSAIGPTVACWILLWRTHGRDLGRLVCFSAAWGLGTGVSSLLWWLLSQIPDAPASTLRYLDTGFWAMAAMTLAFRLPRLQAAPGGRPRRRVDPGVMGALAILIPIAALAAITFVARSVVAPHGEWDAWAIWNARARALFLGLAEPGGHSIPLPVLAHADYPELLARSIARAWTFAGIDDVTVPVMFAALFAGFATLLAGASISHRRGAARGLLTAAFILASPALVNWTWSQGADVPLSFYVLLTLVFAAAAVTIKAPSLWAFTGLSAGLAAWTKNEGIVFFVVMAMIGTAWTWRTQRASLLSFVAGAAPALLVLTMFKLHVTFTNELLAAQSVSRAIALFTWERLSMIGRAMAGELWFGGASIIGPLPVLGLFIATERGPQRISGSGLPLVAIAIMLAAYALIYVLTPRDLAWHLGSSLDRLILQLMPSMVWVGMLVAGGGERSER
jgi:hypothetical protein